MQKPVNALIYSVGKVTSREKAQAISVLRHKYRLEVLLEAAKLPRVTYYYHAKRLDAPDKYGEVVAETEATYAGNKGHYGNRRITLELYQQGRRRKNCATPVVTTTIAVSRRS